MKEQDNSLKKLEGKLKPLIIGGVEIKSSEIKISDEAAIALGTFLKKRIERDKYIQKKFSSKDSKIKF